MSYSPGFSNPFGFTVTPWVKRLLIANIAVFFVTLAFSRLAPSLAFTPSELLARPWTIATYMFVHLGFFHLLFNMLGLFFFGPPLEERWGSREFLKFYILAGAGGALLSFVFWNQPIAGASAAVYGVMVAFAVYWPDNPIYIWGIFPVKAKYLVGFLVFLSLFYAVSGDRSGVAHLAHLGGAVAAFGYLKSPWAPPLWGERPRAATRRPSPRRSWNFLARLTNRARTADRSSTTPTPVRPVSKPSRGRSQDEVDRILDKISEDGISSLTPEERRRLEEASKRFRSN